MSRIYNAALAAAIFLSNVLLNRPLFMTGELPFRGSIEGGYASMARFVTAHPNPWGWDPYQYCGLPAQYLYLPGLSYLTAAFAHLLPGAQPENVYRVLTAVFACLGPVTLFLFALYFTRSRWWALVAALAYTVFSPAFGLLPHLLADRGTLALPWRIQVLARYGEGPHVAGLTLAPLALMAVWAAGTGRRYRQVFAAAALLAAVVLINWIAGLALAFACLLLMLAAWRTGKATGFRARRAFAAAALAYLLACFWLTPRFIDTVAFNWPADSFSYHLARPQILLIGGIVAGLLLLRLLFLRFPRRYYLCFVTMAAFLYGWVAVIFSRFGIDTIPESRRYALEFEMFLILALVEWFRLAMENRNSTVRFCAILPAAVMLLEGAPQGWGFLTLSRSEWQPAPKEQTIEYRVAGWLSRQNLSGRVFASGGLRYRLDSWFEIPQVGGAWESGLRNRVPLGLAYAVRTGRIVAPGRRVEDDLLQLKTLGAQYVVIHGPKSREYYRDFSDPREFEGVLPVVWHEEDDTIYALAPPTLAHVVRREELPPWHHPRKLPAYVAALEDPARPRLKADWRGTDVLAVQGAVPPGMLVEVQVSYDPGWTAAQDGRAIPVEPDMLGYIVLAARPAEATRIELRYRGTGEQRLMAVVSGLAWLAALGGLCVRRRLIGR